MIRHAFSLRPWLALAIVMCAFPAAGPVAQTADTARYKTYDEMTAALRGLAQSNGNLVKLVDLGKSHEGRSVWAVEIATGAGTPGDARPARNVEATPSRVRFSTS